MKQTKQTMNKIKKQKINSKRKNGWKKSTSKRMNEGTKKTIRTKKYELMETKVEEWAKRNKRKQNREKKEGKQK